MPSNHHLILCCPLLLLPSISPTNRVFSSESALHQVAKVLELQLQHSFSPSSECSGLISFRIDWFDLLTVQGTLKSLPQHHNLKASVLWCSVFFMVQLSHLYITTGKTMALTIGTFVSKVVSLLFNTLSRFVIAFLPRSKRLNFMAVVTVILEPKKVKSVITAIFSLLFAMKLWDWMLWSLLFECWVSSMLFHFLHHQEVLEFLFTFSH